tara:strand:+ start:228 stop:338 length:111 start_codon:yes stop_codon:yes gene_type:complete
MTKEHRARLEEELKELLRRREAYRSKRNDDGNPEGQ